MLRFSVSWDAQAGLFVCWLRFAAESGFDFGFLPLTWMSLVVAEEHSVRRACDDNRMRRMFERSEFGASGLTRAPQGIRPKGPDGGLGDRVFAYFFRCDCYDKR